MFSSKVGREEKAIKRTIADGLNVIKNCSLYNSPLFPSPYRRMLWNEQENVNLRNLFVIFFAIKQKKILKIYLKKHQFNNFIPRVMKREVSTLSFKLRGYQKVRGAKRYESSCFNLGQGCLALLRVCFIVLMNVFLLFLVYPSNIVLENNWSTTCRYSRLNNSHKVNRELRACLSRSQSTIVLFIVRTCNSKSRNEHTSDSRANGSSIIIKTESICI